MLNQIESNRVFGLDLFRAIAIILVVIGHGYLVAGNLFESLPTIRLLDGVELFFVLSGFLIGTILLKIIENENGLSFKSILSFWKRRWFRTLPNYYLILIINVILVNYGIINGDIKQFGIDFFFFVQNFYEGYYDFFWESWSLSVEEWFYIFLPLLCFFSLLIVPRKYAILSVILLLIITPLLYRISIADIERDRFWWDVEIRKVVITRLDAIMFGVLAAYIKYYFTSFWIKFRVLFGVIGVTLIWFVVYHPQEPNSFYQKTIYFTLTSFGSSLLLPFADSIQHFKYKFIEIPITFISKISYSMYLVNMALVAQVIEKNFSLTTKTEHLIAYIAFWTFTIVISSALYFWYEKPMTNLRDRF